MYKTITLPTYITLFRFALIPVIITNISLNQWHLALLFFLLAIISDFLDGYLARTFNQRSMLGAILDPIADKLLILSMLGIFIFFKPVFSIHSWLFYVLFIKELILVIGICSIFLVSGTIQIKPHLIGKLAMLLQSVFIVILLLKQTFGLFADQFIYILGWLVLLVSIAAFLQYCWIGLKHLCIVK